MQLARVIGDVVATRKDASFEGVKLLLVQPLAADGSAVGRALVAVDAMGAGVGEHVFFVRGKEASFPFYPTEMPADAGIVGIVDHWNNETSSEPRSGGAPTAPRSGGTPTAPASGSTPDATRSGGTSVPPARP